MTIKNPDVLRKQEKEINWIKGLISSAQQRRWFGKMTLEFKDGMVDIIRNEETLKPPKEGK